MARVFLSHATGDKPRALELLAWLRSESHSETFLDSDPDTGIPAGADWERTLYKELKRSQAVVILLTTHWMESKWCFAEFAQARALGKAIFPVVVTPAGELSVGRDLQAIDLTSEREGGLDRLARALNDIALASPGDFVLPPGVSPFPGLDPLGEEQAAVFFGRDEDTSALIERLRKSRTQGGSRFVPIVGASGSGKSSLLLAGLLPRLKRDARNWLLLQSFRLETEPAGRLADRLVGAARGAAATARMHEELPIADWRRTILSDQPAPALRSVAESIRRSADRPDASILIAVDQMETLFALADKTERDGFLALLGQALDGSLPYYAVATLRNEYLADLQEVPVLSVDLEPYTLAPIPFERLPELVRGPARLAGLEVEDALVDGLIADVTSVDALPLVAFTLRRLYEAAREGGRLTLASYQMLGDPALGLSPLDNAVRRAAEEALPLSTRTPTADATLKRTFIPSLVQISPDGKYVRRPATIESLPPEARDQIDRLVGARLLVKRTAELDGEERAVVEVAHESLFRVWDRLADWIGEERDFLVGKSRIAQAYGDYRLLSTLERERKMGLLSGVLLERARSWVTDRPDAFSPEELAFIEESIRHDDEQRERIARLRRWLLRTSLSASVIFAAAAVSLGWLWGEADEARSRAVASLHVAQSKTALRDGDVDRAVAKALAGLEVGDTVKTRSAALSALLELSPYLAVAPNFASDSDTLLAWKGLSTLALSTPQGVVTLDVRDPNADLAPIQTGSRPENPGDSGLHPSSRATLLYFGADGKGILVREDGSVAPFGVDATPIPIRGSLMQRSPFLAAAAAERATNGIRVAMLAAYEGVVIRDCPGLRGLPWPARDGCRDRFHPMDLPVALAIAPLGERVAVADNARRITILEPDRGFLINAQREIDSDVVALHWSNRPDHLAVGTRRRGMLLLDAGSPVLPEIRRVRQGESIPLLRWSPDGERLAFVCDRQDICVGSPVRRSAPYRTGRWERLSGHSGALTALAWSPDGTRIASLAVDDRRLRIWSMVQERSLRYALRTGVDRPLIRMAVDPTAGRIAAGDTEGNVWVWMADGSRIHLPAPSETAAPVTELAWDHRLGQLIVVYENQAVARWDPRVHSQPRFIRLPDTTFSRAASLADGRVAVPLGDGRIALLFATGAPPVFLDRTGGRIEARAVAAHPDGERLYAVYTDGSIHTWDLGLGGPPRTLVAADIAGPGASGAGSLALDAEGRVIAASRDDDAVVVYDAIAGVLLHRLGIHGRGSNTVAFSASGRRLAVLGSDGRIDVWDLDAPKEPLVFGVPGVPDRSTAGRVGGLARKATWAAWLGSDKLVVATAAGEVYVYNLDADAWTRRAGVVFGTVPAVNAATESERINE